jgi:hypothetical protein
VLDELAGPRGREGDPVLVRLCLRRNADLHSLPSPSTT